MELDELINCYKDNFEKKLIMADVEAYKEQEEEYEVEAHELPSMRGRNNLCYNSVYQNFDDHRTIRTRMFSKNSGSDKGS